MILALIFMFIGVVMVGGFGGMVLAGADDWWAIAGIPAGFLVMLSVIALHAAGVL